VIIHGHLQKKVTVRREHLRRDLRPQKSNFQSQTCLRLLSQFWTAVARKRGEDYPNYEER
jgi:hypothetical protein